MRIRFAAVLVVAGIVVAGVSGCAPQDWIDKILNPPVDDAPPTVVLQAEIADVAYQLGYNPNLRAPLDVQFDASDSLDSGGQPVLGSQAERTDFLWDFGDGSPVVGPEDDLVRQLHRFIDPGVYTVTVTATSSSSGQTDSESVTVTVGEPWLDIIREDTDPQVSGQVLVIVHFSNESERPLYAVGVWLYDDDGSIGGAVKDYVALGLPPLAPMEDDSIQLLIDPPSGFVWARSMWCDPIPPAP
ncbi:PKD domain-containing protein [Candidatus Bipolaricaulota bacterium]|nr:PKD domain-containing protein [Candidatus Bipolaricaulota bacterium]